MDAKHLASSYDEWHRKVYTAYHQNLPKRFWEVYLDYFKFIGPVGKKLLDVACGPGHFLLVAKSLGYEIHGVDISPVTIKKKKKTVEGDLRVGMAEKLPYRSNQFDLVTCIGSLEHFIDQDKSLLEMRRVLKNDGKLFIYVPNLFFLAHVMYGWLYGAQPSEGGQDFSEHFYTVKGWRELIERNGFKIEKIEKFNDVFAAKRVNWLVKVFYQAFLRHILPTNLSYSFMILVRPEE
ncbi:class I SAM-dependent methyltransferase [Candidatus Berkelbacteria bacterium]|nr:class I SAM-dependent methyltransferase [Candidatus Berkelbacteria bacterium]